MKGECYHLPVNRVCMRGSCMITPPCMGSCSCQILGMKIIIICYIIPNMSIAPAVGCINFVQHCTGHSRGGYMELYVHVVNDDLEFAIYQVNSMHM